MHSGCLYESSPHTTSYIYICRERKREREREIEREREKQQIGLDREIERDREKRGRGIERERERERCFLDLVLLAKKRRKPILKLLDLLFRLLHAGPDDLLGSLVHRRLQGRQTSTRSLCQTCCCRGWWWLRWWLCWWWCRVWLGCGGTSNAKRPSRSPGASKEAAGGQEPCQSEQRQTKPQQAANVAKRSESGLSQGTRCAERGLPQGTRCAERGLPQGTHVAESSLSQGTHVAERSLPEDFRQAAIQ